MQREGENEDYASRQTVRLCPRTVPVDRSDLLPELSSYRVRFDPRDRLRNS